MIEIDFPDDLYPEEAQKEQQAAQETVKRRLRVDSQGREHLENETESISQKREKDAPAVRWVALFFMLGLVGLGVRLFQLQIVQHHLFAVRANSNFQRDDVLRAVRGQIRTRDGVLLATSRTVYDLVYLGRRHPEDAAQAIPDWDRIKYLAGVKPEVLVGGQPREPDRRKEADVVLASNIPQSRLSALSEYLVMVPSLEIRERFERIYPQGKLAAHLIGYVQQANDQHVSSGEFSLGDLVGRSGVEASLQKELQGTNGLRRREVSASGKPLTESVIDPGKKGQDVTLTIDSTLQKAAERVLQEGLADINAGRRKYGRPRETVSRGAVIAIDPRTNEVLAMASSPTFDPNWFSQTPSPDPKARNWAVDPNRENAALDAVTANRVVQSYNPGSVFKPATALMYVEKWGNFTAPCPPVYYFGRARFRNWAHFNLGYVDARRAIAYSCNPWFYGSAVRASPGAYSRQLKSRLTELGYRGPTGLELIGEKTGQIMDIDDYSSPKAPWYPGFGLNMSIGQGDTLVTPAQQAYVLSTIMNRGRQRPLTVVKAFDQKVQPTKPWKSVVRNGNVGVFDLVKEGMSWTTILRIGTSSFEIGPGLFPVRTAGKTGTAENGLSRRNGYSYTHAWYEGYGPLSDPNFLVVTFFQNGGEGSGPALKAAKKMFAARWCVTLNSAGNALPPRMQQPCTGELSDMHAVYKARGLE